MHAGMTVPPGFVVPVEVYEAAVALGGGEPVDTLPDAWSRSLRDAARRLGGPLAVRSSAPVEDGQDASYAGQFATLLGIEPDDVVQAVQAVWRSASSSVAQSYARGEDRPVMAVVVQRMVDADAAGVMFTIHPLHGSWREMVVEAVWGLGDGLVSGRTTPQTFVLRRPRWAPRGLRRLISRMRVDEVEASHVRQQHWDRWTPEGMVREPLPPRLVGQRVLQPTELRRLARLGLRLERQLGRAQDIEWVRDRDGLFVVVQARPVTVVPRQGPREVLWTRRFIGERWPMPSTPMGWSVVEPVLSWFIAYPRTQARFLGGGPALREVDGHPYVNSTVFRHLAFKVPGGSPPSFMMELLPPEEVRAWRARYAALPDLRVYSSIFEETIAERRWERFAYNPFTNHQVWRRWRDGADARLALWPTEPANPGEAVARVDEAMALLRGYVGVHITSLLFANLYYQLLQGALALWMPDAGRATMGSLAVCPPGNQTLQTNRDLWSLACLATDEDLTALRDRGPLRPAFDEALQRFLSRHGGRAEASWDVFSERWRDRPSVLVPLLRAARQEQDPAINAARQEEAWAEAVQTVRRNASPGTVPTLLGLVHFTRRYLLLRENQRVWLEGLMDRMAGDLRWLGACLVERGVVDQPDDIAFLAWSEVRSLLQSERSGMPLVADRRQRWQQARRQTPPTFLQGNRAVEDPSGGRLQGVGVSAGSARGRVRVLRTLADADSLESGEILVATAIDPAWTPLFLTAAAVVVELGGALAHGAVVAREYQLPMVVNLDGVTRALADGMDVTVDGNTGAVWVHDA